MVVTARATPAARTIELTSALKFTRPVLAHLLRESRWKVLNDNRSERQELMARRCYLHSIGAERAVLDGMRDECGENSIGVRAAGARMDFAARARIFVGRQAIARAMIPLSSTGRA